MKRKIRWLCGCLAVVLLIVCGVVYSVSADTVTITDPQLESALKAALNTTAITEARMESLTDLDLSGKNISDLTGLEKAKNLKTLSLRNNRISDLSALAGLSGLETLDVCGNQIASLVPLNGLNCLRVLQLTDNQVADLSAVANLKMLQFVFCERNKLDTTVGSETMKTIDAMRFRGMFVELGEESEQQPEQQPDDGPTELSLKEGSLLKLDRSTQYLTGVEPGTDISVLYQDLEYGNYTLRLRNGSDESISQSLIGTGMQVQMVNSKDEVIDQFTVLVYGDVNGDGTINIIDLAMMRRDIVTNGELLDGAAHEAANLSKRIQTDADDQVINVIDLAIMRKYIVGALEIPQS